MSVEILKCEKRESQCSNCAHEIDVDDYFWVFETEINNYANTGYTMVLLCEPCIAEALSGILQERFCRPDD